jgi:YfiH family protein
MAAQTSDSSVTNGRHADQREASPCEARPNGASRTAPRATQSALLAFLPWLRHGLSYRIPGLGQADGNVGFGPPRDKDDAWAMRQQWCAGMGVDASRIVTMGQVHGADMLRVEADDAGKGATPNSEHLGLADALITDAPGVVLTTLHADCLPILLVDPDRPAIAAVHAGWRGTVAGVAEAAVSAMRDAYGSRPERMLAYLGAAIHVCCNEVGSEVTAAWRDRAASLGERREQAVTKPGEKEHFDVPLANALLLQRAGLLPEHIEIDPACTKCDGEHWFSHRGQGPLTGRMGAFIMLATEDSRGA